jgi:D-cysteine desulfhydrase
MYGSKVTYQIPSWLQNELPTNSKQSWLEPTGGLSRILLANAPTPIHKVQLSDALLPQDLGVELYVKRDDFTGSELSGNKVRKLEFIMGEALAQQCDSVVTLGGIQSNHCRATVAAANMLGLEPHVILRTSRFAVEEDPGVAGNLLVSRLANAHIHLVTKEEYAKYGQDELGKRLAQELRNAGRKPYVIPVGGSSALGTMGYLNMVEELRTQLTQDDGRPFGAFDKIAVTCGSGGTCGGLALGLFCCLKDTALDAMMVCDDEMYFREYIIKLYADLGIDGARAEEILDRTTFVQAKGAGYSISKEEELDTILEVASDTSIVLDPCYTGKAMHYYLRHVRENPDHYRNKRILFVHTGGLSSVYGNEMLAARLAAGNITRMNL